MNSITSGMGFGFSKSIKLFGGLRLNLSKSCVGISGGSKERASALARVAHVRLFLFPVRAMSYVSTKGYKKKTSMQQVPFRQRLIRQGRIRVPAGLLALSLEIMAGTNPGFEF
jgi:hypothetical protein